MQHMLDSNITMCLDECTPFPATEAQAESSMRLSMRWARRSKDAFVERPATACSASSRAASIRSSGRRASPP
ncbi:hypothetical protein [Azospirillum sp. INR13]|uniref:hypothetical protein n=1 Tax=Azospirillum sp. INR13 TaxID=2596919 RepID=UPI00351C06EC